MARIALLAAALLAVSPHASAADARALFQAGTKALEAGNGGEALSNFEAAYQAQPAPALLFWIAEAFLATGNKTEAASFYRKYVEQMPAGPKVPDAKARLAAFASEGKPAPAKKAAKSSKSAKTSKKKSTMALEEISLDAVPAAKPAAPPPKAKLAKAEPSKPVVAPVVPAAAPSAPPPAPSPAAPPPPVAVAMKEALPATTPAPAPAAAPAAVPASTMAPPPVAPANRTQLTSVTPPSEPPNYVGYTARLITLHSKIMGRYATTTSLSTDGGSLYTHGISAGRQGEYFRNSVYFGFGTQWGGGTDTMLRYELSWQGLWTPLGASGVVSPRLGIRLGGMAVKGEFLTSGSLKPGIVIAPTAGLDLNLGKHLVLSAGAGYDANLGVSFTHPDASVSGWSIDGGAALRF